MNNNKIKVTFAGSATTGKTSIVLRMKYNTFDHSTTTTIGVNFLRVEYKNVNYELWDTAGQERYHALIPMYFKGSKIIVFVFSVDDPATMRTIGAFIKGFTDIDDYKLIIVGNKTDLIQETDLENIIYSTKQFFNSLEIKDRIHSYIFMSAKTGNNFDTFLNELYKCASGVLDDDISVAINGNDLIMLDNDLTTSKKCQC